MLYTALTLAVGLIAHPTVLLYLPTFIYIVGLNVWRRRTRQHWPWLVGGMALFFGLTAFFYVPYLTSPDIGLVYQYFADERIGTSLLYNLVDNMLGEDELYSSRYHTPVLVLLLTWLLARNFVQIGLARLVYFWGFEPGYCQYGHLARCLAHWLAEPGFCTLCQPHLDFNSTPSHQF